MATWDDVERVAAGLPEPADATSYGNSAWTVHGTTYAWERPLGRSDLAALGDQAPPDGPILAVRVDGLDEKEAVLAAHPDCCFSTPHFNGYPAVLVLLDRIDPARLEELMIDAWLSRAPKRLAARYLEDHPPR